MTEIDEKELEILKSKACHYDKIADKLADFYADDVCEDDVDLSDIGQWMAEYFNWI